MDRILREHTAPPPPPPPPPPPAIYTHTHTHLRDGVTTGSVLIDGLGSGDGDSDVVPSLGELGFVADDELVFQRLDDVVDLEDDFVALVDFHEPFASPRRQSLDGR